MNASGAEANRVETANDVELKNGNPWLFVSDLHGSDHRYEKLYQAIIERRPAVVLLGGDLFPHAMEGGFLDSTLIPLFRKLRAEMGDTYPPVLLILGNDDPRSFESRMREVEAEGLWTYVHGKKVTVGQTSVYGYACVPPTPFRLKDWERYDVSRYCDPGCVPLEQGVRTVAMDMSGIIWTTIKDDLAHLTSDDALRNAVFLFHAPPYGTSLDRAGLDGMMVDHAPLDVHVGSIAIQRFITARQPRLTLHGHVHESSRLTGEWKAQIGSTVCLGAAHDGPELALVSFDVNAPQNATRELL